MFGFRRRRRRGGFAQRNPQQRFIIIGAAAVAVIGIFAFFVRQADVLAPEPRETRIDLPDAFKD